MADPGNHYCETRKNHPGILNIGTSKQSSLRGDGKIANTPLVNEGPQLPEDGKLDSTGSFLLLDLIQGLRIDEVWILTEVDGIAISQSQNQTEV